MALKRGDIAIVTQGELGRPRPVVVVQTDDLSETTTVLACPITSKLSEHLPLRPVVQPGPETGLQNASQVMTDKLLPVRRDRVRRIVGKVDANVSEQLDRALLIVLGLGR